MQIALPQKLFEAIGYGKPIISFGNTAASRFIKKSNIGWCKEYSEEYNFFNYLIENPDEIMQKTDNVLSIRTQHTWARRVKDVIKTIVKD